MRSRRFTGEITRTCARSRPSASRTRAPSWSRTRTNSGNTSALRRFVAGATRISLGERIRHLGGGSMDPATIRANQP